MPGALPSLVPACWLCAKGTGSIALGLALPFNVASSLGVCHCPSLRCSFLFKREEMASTYLYNVSRRPANAQPQSSVKQRNPHPFEAA